jgi:tRNA pseudouridine38-40 synthase
VDKSGKSTLCDLKRLTIQEKKGEILLSVTANRFLHKMVRMIVGLLVDVGRGKLRVSCVDHVFKPGGPVRKLGFCAPPQGLCLIKILY